MKKVKNAPAMPVLWDQFLEYWWENKSMDHVMPDKRLPDGRALTDLTEADDLGRLADHLSEVASFIRFMEWYCSLRADSVMTIVDGGRAYSSASRADRGKTVAAATS